MKEGQKRSTHKKTSRREFLAAAGGVMIVPRHVLGGSQVVAPSDRLNLAIIGTGGQGLVNMRALLREPDVQIVALADVNEESDYSRFYYGGSAGLRPALNLLARHRMEEPGVRPRPYEDFRRLLDQEGGLDGVVVATPDHVHASASLAAIHRGKHVYCEKPLTHSIDEARAVSRAARDAGVATQMGNQGHSGEGIRRTCEWIWDGAIGDISSVAAWTGAGNWADGGRPSATPPAPVTLNWDLWLGPALYRPYHPAYAPYNWRGWWDFGTGAIGDMACHNLDPAFWALDLGHPQTAEAIDTRRHAEIVPPESTVRYTFPATSDRPAVTVTWYDGDRRPEKPESIGPDVSLGGNGILFYGEKGAILCGGWGGEPRLFPESLADQYTPPEPTLPRSEGHHRDWLNACKGGPPPSAGFEYSAHLTEVVLLGNVAQRVGGVVEWDGDTMTVTNIPEANRFIRPERRENWELPPV